MVKKKFHNNPGNNLSFKTTARKTASALKYVQAYQSGDPSVLSSEVYHYAKDWLNKHLPDGMAPRRKHVVAKKKKVTRRRKNNFMGVTSIPCRRVIAYEASSGTKHRWLYNINLGLFMNTFRDEYQDFKMVSLNVRYIPNNSTNETGLYAAVLLDSTGFGGWGSATGISWFPTIGAMPGAKIRPRYVASTFRWRPTEPSAREWRTRNDTAITYCTIYICNNGKETDELGGLLEITGKMLVRGLYYNATVKKIINQLVAEQATTISASPLNIGDIEADVSRPDSSQEVSRPSSRALSYGGFVTLG